MKTIIAKWTMLAIGLVAHAYSVTAQCNEWTWPEDKATAEEKNVLYGDALKSDNYKAAQAPHMWLLQNAPNLNTSIYINGEKLYKGLIEMAQSEARKKVLIDSLMLIYDMRIANCGEEASVISRKAYSDYFYNSKKKDELKGILDLFDKAYELNGTELEDHMLLPYMYTVYLYKKTYPNNLSDDEILERYDKIKEVLGHKFKQESDPKARKKIIGYEDRIDNLLAGIIKFDCEMVRAKLGPKFKADPENLNLAKKILGFMMNAKCTDDPLWLEAAKKVQEKEPSYGLAKHIGIKYGSINDISNAEKYFNEAISLADNNPDKADIYIIIGGIKADRGQKAAARDMYKKALALNPSRRELYGAIGNLYFSSFEECAGKEDIVKDRAVYLIAYDMFEKGNNRHGMEAAKAQFPSKEDIFTYNYEVGKSITVGGWINETTVIRSRD